MEPGRHSLMRVGRRIDIDHLVDSAEIADRLGLTNQTTVNQWTRRHPDFPRPVKMLSRVGLWDWLEVERWARRTGRLPR